MYTHTHTHTHSLHFLLLRDTSGGVGMVTEKSPDSLYRFQLLSSETGQWRGAIAQQVSAATLGAYGARDNAIVLCEVLLPETIGSAS